MEEDCQGVDLVRLERDMGACKAGEDLLFTNSDRGLEGKGMRGTWKVDGRPSWVLGRRATGTKTKKGYNLGLEILSRCTHTFPRNTPLVNQREDRGLGQILGKGLNLICNGKNIH